MFSGAIYLDNNASTAPHPEVVEAVSKAMRDLYANASSAHPLGQAASRGVEDGRRKIAALLRCPTRGITFTSGASEADSLAIHGLWEAAQDRGDARRTLVVGATEHRAVLEAAASLQKQGARVCIAPVDRFGVIDLQALRDLVDDSVLLVSVMAANSETGTLNPLHEVVAIAKEAGAYVHSDATQQIGRVAFDMQVLDLDLVSMSAHKMHGPKGIGALVARRGVQVAPQIYGGGHERGLRSGTLNTPAIVGFGVAAELAAARLTESERISERRDRLHAQLQDKLAGVVLNGHPVHRLPNTLNLRFTGADAEAVMASLPMVACSVGSACHSGMPEPSHVLLAMGLDATAATESLRFSLSRYTTDLEINAATEQIVDAVCYVRNAMAAEIAS